MACPGVIATATRGWPGFALVPTTNAVVGIDLADAKQMVVVSDHDSKVRARRTFRCRAWDLGLALDWAAERAAARGFAGVTVACEPTGHRWRVLGQLAADRSMPFVCVQPMLNSWARRSEDLTFDKTDEKDAVLIARLTGQLRCYIPEPVDETWGRLRHLGARREQLIVEATGQVQQIRALLECVWPAALETAQQPLKSITWVSAMSIILERDGGDLARTRRLGLERFETAVRGEIIRSGRQKPCGRILRRLFTTLADPAGVISHRPGALERVGLLLGDLRETHRRLHDAEARMLTVLDELKLTELVTSITGLSAIGAASILAETGDPNRFATARALVKHSGLAPREKLSGKSSHDASNVHGFIPISFPLGAGSNRCPVLRVHGGRRPRFAPKSRGPRRRPAPGWPYGYRGNVGSTGRCRASSSASAQPANQPRAASSAAKMSYAINAANPPVSVIELPAS